jgi:hypothetical protein
LRLICRLPASIDYSHSKRSGFFVTPFVIARMRHDDEAISPHLDCQAELVEAGEQKPNIPPKQP